MKIYFIIAAFIYSKLKEKQIYLQFNKLYLNINKLKLFKLYLELNIIL